MFFNLKKLQKCWRNIAGTLFLFCVLSSTATAVDLPPELRSASPLPDLKAKSWVLLEQETGLVIAGNEADMPIEPASLTKLMTIYVVFDLLSEGKIQLDDSVTISEKARYVEGSRMFAELNSQVSVIDLIKSVIVQSGNDASIALAEHIDGSETVFVKRMNQKVKELGLQNSQFQNVTGLTADNHYASAKDIALLGRAIIRDFPQYYPWYSLKEMTYNDIRQQNRNLLLGRKDWVDGLKTGYTKAAGYCLAATGKQNGDRFIAVVTGLDSKIQRANEAQQLLNYAFANYEIFSLDTSLFQRQTDVYGGEKNTVQLGVQPLNLVVPKGVSSEIKISTTIDDHLLAPIDLNQNAGILRLNYNGNMIGASPVLTQEVVKQGGIFKRIADRVKRLLN
jgi:D-alanyl-D-alanine carboxypeptidase (penicillin-binding protein 5/6)